VPKQNRRDTGAALDGAAIALPGSTILHFGGDRVIERSPRRICWAC